MAESWVPRRSVGIIFFFKQAALSYEEGPLQKEGGDDWPRPAVPPGLGPQDAFILRLL